MFSVYCVFTVILLFSTTCYWGADRCWLDLNNFHIFDPIRRMDGSPASTFGLQLPAFMTKIEDYLEVLLRILGGGEPLATVIRAGHDFSTVASVTGTAAAKATGEAAASAVVANGLGSVADAVSSVLISAATGGNSSSP
ncbi:hypothetical protein BG011_008882 [Mortierella polycephala]|uniref:Uncharacterized protein n=1 Tax=Mortierella polycephala TaxID=41804 RepID=A0A9P6Q950_9FUNG|nr:hypothetical protein BG011_008882 [Mortierella polycephala]